MRTEVDRVKVDAWMGVRDLQVDETGFADVGGKEFGCDLDSGQQQR